MQSIPILCHWNPVIVHAPREPEPFLLWLQCSLVFLSFLLDVFLWHLTEHWLWARVRAVEGRSSWVGEFPIMSCFTLTTVQDAQRDNHAQLLPWSRLVEKEQLLFHLWQNKRLSNIPVHKLLCKQNTASKPSSKASYIKKIQGELVAFSWSLHENVTGFILSCSKMKFCRKNNQGNGHMHSWFLPMELKLTPGNMASMIQVISELTHKAVTSQI